MTDTATEPREAKLREHTFMVKPTMSSKDFGVLTAFGKGEVQGNLHEIISTVVRNTLVADSRPAWDALWDMDLDVPISFQELADFANSIAEVGAGRPTQQPSPSGNTESNGQMSSTEDSASMVEKAISISPSGLA